MLNLLQIVKVKQWLLITGCILAVAGSGDSDIFVDQRDAHLTSFFGGLPTSVGAKNPVEQDDAAIEKYQTALQSNPNDSDAKDGLKRLIDRPNPVSPGQNQRIRELLRQHPWPGKASLIFTGEPGEPLIISGTVRDAKGKPVTGAILNLFQTDMHGQYTRAAAMDEPHARLFAFIKTGGDGRFEFNTIRPGGYPGRPDRQGEQWRIPQHIHFQVTAAGYQFRNFQMVFADDPRMTPYWYEWARKGKHPVVAVIRDKDGVQRGVCDIELQ